MDVFTVKKLRTMTTDAPKRKKNASRKNKKSWRKNVDIDDVEEFLEEERLEAAQMTNKGAEGSKGKAGAEWSTEELQLLIKAVKSFPPGTVNR